MTADEVLDRLDGWRHAGVRDAHPECVGQEPGREILYPVATVILGGLISSTLLDTIVTPAVFYRFGRKSAEKYLAGASEES